MSDTTQPKTYKREVATCMLVYYYAMNTLGIWYPEAVTAAASVMVATFTFAGGAFALDVAAKQWK